MTEPTEEQLVKEAIHILSISEYAHRRATPDGKENYRKELWALTPPYRIFIGRLYDFGKNFHGTDLEVLKYWQDNETEVSSAGKHMVPHLINDPMVEMYIVRALGILQAENVLQNTGITSGG